MTLYMTLYMTLWPKCYLAYIKNKRGVKFHPDQRCRPTIQSLPCASIFAVQPLPMPAALPLPLGMFREHLVLTDQYPSGLAWKKSNGWHKKGEMAGKLNPRTQHYLVTLGGSTYLAHRIVYGLVSGTDPGSARIYHLSEDHDNRKGLSLVPGNYPYIAQRESQVAKQDTCMVNDTLA